MRQLDGAFRTRPLAALIFGLAMLSLAGLPPLPGFFAKLLVFRSVIASGHLPTAIVAFIGSLAAVGLVRQEDFVPSGAPPDNGPTPHTRGG